MDLIFLYCYAKRHQLMTPRIIDSEELLFSFSINTAFRIRTSSRTWNFKINLILSDIQIFELIRKSVPIWPNASSICSTYLFRLQNTLRPTVHTFYPRRIGLIFNTPHRDLNACPGNILYRGSKWNKRSKAMTFQACHEQEYNALDSIWVH